MRTKKKSPSYFYSEIFILVFISCCAHQAQNEPQTNHPTALITSVDIAKKIAVCSEQTKKGDTCLAELESLRPTQFAIGYRDVERKRLKIEKEGNKDTFVTKSAGIAVKGPEDLFYIVDGHHRARALLEAHGTHLQLKIIEDYGDLVMNEFWRNMVENKYVWLFDENGIGPRSPLELPTTLSELRDDPYRTLAEDAQDRGANKKLNLLYQEFYWANFYRSRITKDLILQNYDGALEAALKLAKSSAAKDLPGYDGALD